MFCTIWSTKIMIMSITVYPWQLTMSGRAKLTGRRQRVAIGKTNRSQANYGSNPNPNTAADAGRSQRRKVNVVRFNKKSPKMKARMNEIKCMYVYRNQICTNPAQPFLNQKIYTWLLFDHCSLKYAILLIRISKFGQPAFSKERCTWQLIEKHNQMVLASKEIQWNTDAMAFMSGIGWYVWVTFPWLLLRIMVTWITLCYFRMHTQLYRDMDANHDGVISTAEFSRAMKDIHIHDKDIKDMVRRFDSNDDGVIIRISSSFTSALFLVFLLSLTQSFRSFRRPNSGMSCLKVEWYSIHVNTQNAHAYTNASITHTQVQVLAHTQTRTHTCAHSYTFALTYATMHAPTHVRGPTHLLTHSLTHSSIADAQEEGSGNFLDRKRDIALGASKAALSHRLKGDNDPHSFPCYRPRSLTHPFILIYLLLIALTIALPPRFILPFCTHSSPAYLHPYLRPPPLPSSFSPSLTLSQVFKGRSKSWKPKPEMLVRHWWRCLNLKYH